jgi:glucoamylase
MAFANDGGMIPEQIWDRKITLQVLLMGQGTGSATRFAWSMAQFIRLAVNISAGRNPDTPKEVAARYLNRN